MVRIVKDPEERRQELIEAAGRLFARKGYEETAVSDIVREIKVGQGTFYHYFRSKEEILGAVAEKIVAPQAEEVARIAKGDGDPASKVNDMLNSILRANSSEMGLMNLLFKKGNYLLHQKIEEAIEARVLPPLAEMVSRGTAEGCFNAEYPAELIEFLLASALFLSHHIPPDTERRERMRAALEKIAARELGVTGYQFHLEI